MRVDEFDFELPEERIALRPAEPRDAARLLVVRPFAPSQSRLTGVPRMGPRVWLHSPQDEAAGSDGSPLLEDRHVRDLPDLLRPGDVLVLNDTRVVPAQLAGLRFRAPEIVVSATLLERIDEASWWAFTKPGRRLRVGDRIRFGHEGRVCLLGTLDATVAEKLPDGRVRLAFNLHGPYLEEALNGLGDPPLPPYIAARRAADERDRRDYQTIYAAEDGAVAAPTAGLHFTPELFARLDEKGIAREFVTLHVGAGTFLPVKADEIAEHRMHAERGTIRSEVAERLNRARAAGGRVVAVGTTSLRLLESAAAADGTIQPFQGATDIFITPGYRFRAVDLLISNFHVPRSTLFMLVSAFSGRATMRRAYRHAIATGYRFYSYGDASLLYPEQRQ